MWDVFICHAWEDKEDIARPLAHALQNAGLRVWYDEFTLKVGDSLRRSINYGLSQSKYGIVILSPHFFAKEWPQRELDGLVAKEINSGKVILPIWHIISRKEVERFSPVLADRIGVSTSSGLDIVLKEILRVIRPEASPIPESIRRTGYTRAKEKIAESLMETYKEKLNNLTYSDNKIRNKKILICLEDIKIAYLFCTGKNGLVEQYHRKTLQEGKNEMSDVRISTTVYVLSRITEREMSHIEAILEKRMYIDGDISTLVKLLRAVQGFAR